VVEPAFAVISVGFHTSFGLPKPDVLARLQAAGVRTYRTDLNGAVTFVPRRPLCHPRVAAEQLERNSVLNGDLENRQDGIMRTAEEGSCESAR
jgi:beta-lactamase superfamily II metal-dependent hydrolase